MDNLQHLAGQLAQGAMTEEDVARALLEMTLDAAPPDVAEAARVAALPAWFDEELLAYLLEGLKKNAVGRLWNRLTGNKKRHAAQLIQQIATFSFVQLREDGGYVYHEATRARLLDVWQTPENHKRFATLTEHLAQRYLALARKYSPRLKGPEYLDALAILDAAYPNIQAAWENTVAAKLWNLIPDFAYAAIADYQSHRGLWHNLIKWTESGIEAAQQEKNDLAVASLQNNLGIAYRNLPTGDRGDRSDRTENLQRAIQCYEQALTVYTPDAAPLDYAMTQNNLGTAYSDLPTGNRGDQDRTDNLRRAIQCYEQALRFRTPDAAPLQYATTQNNLGTAYSDLPTGDRGDQDRAENLQRAIQCYEQALTVYTPDAAPLQYATTQNNLGTAYLKLPTGDRGDQDRAENLQRAIQCYEQALRFRTPDAAPLQYATTQYNLGMVYDELGQYEAAATAYHQAANATPENGICQMSLGSVFHKLGRDAEAAEHLARARELLPDDDHYNRACLEAITGNVDAALGHLKKAIAWDATRRDWAARDPDLESLRDDPRFQTLVKKVDGSQ